MAGHGPPPKHPSRRLGHRAKTDAGTVLLPAGGSGLRAPALPRKSPAWLKSTRAWWLEAWRQPEAAAWRPIDLKPLVRLARINDALDRDETPDVRLAAEARQLEDRLGMSPMARRRLQWEIEREAPTDDQRPTDELSAARRARLEVAG